VHQPLNHHADRHADQHADQHADRHAERHQQGHDYRRLLFMALPSFASMYALMYAMVDAWPSVYANLNQAYMAGLMTAPMVVLELLLMRGMYRSARLNALILAASVAGGIACFALIRQQTAIGDRQFLRSMIPHHAGAILMCTEAAIEDPAIVALCRNIVASQRAEIAQMRALLAR
jgi:uncharacterized protein (DUF305 family)